MAHTFTNIVIHALFSTKQRRPYLDAEMKQELFPYMGGIILKLNGQPLLINGPSDHVHLLFVQPAALGLAELMEKVKANSSRTSATSSSSRIRSPRWPVRARPPCATCRTKWSSSIFTRLCTPSTP